MIRRNAWMILGVVLGCCMLWWSVRSVSISVVIAIVYQSAPQYLALAVVASIAFIAIKTWRWKLLLEPIAPVTFAELYGPVNIGTAANLIVSHIGELVRARLLSRSRHRLPLSTVLATIGSERVLDLFTMLVLVAYLLVDGRGQFDSMLVRVADVAAVCSAVAAVILVSMALNSEAWLRWLDVITRRWPERRQKWLRRQFVDLMGGFKTICRPGLLIKALAASLLQWLLIAFALWCCAKSIEVNLHVTAAILVLVLMVFGLTLPTAPGYLGTTQIAFIAALAVFGISRSLAFATSLLYSAFVVLPMFAFGAVAFFGRSEGTQPDRTVA